jgi:hypothetical protein
LEKLNKKRRKCRPLNYEAIDTHYSLSLQTYVRHRVRTPGAPIFAYAVLKWEQKALV